MKLGNVARGGRAVSGIAAAATILQTVTKNRGPSSPPLATVATAVPRMVQATLNGQYQGLSKGKLGLMGAAVAYALSPIDVLPDIILLAIGVVDDAVVLGWVAAALLDEGEKFLAWEKATPGR